jgi:hypothetical protein
MTMTIRVTADDLRYARDEGTVIVLTGTDTATGALVTFAGDRRPVMEAVGTLAQDAYDGIRDSVDLETPADWQVLSTVPLRKGRIRRTSIGGPTGEVAARYLPANYKVTEVTPEWVYFEGHDNAGWTLDDYVIPRLASGLIWAEEVIS